MGAIKGLVKINRMPAISLNLPEILKYGIIGLGGLFATLTYFLIAKEQNSKTERPKLLVTIYVFMIFAVTLIILGLFSEGNDKTKEKARAIAETSLTNMSQKNGDIFFLGKWKGLGSDLRNNGYKDTINSGYEYNFEFTFSIDSIGRINLEGTYTGVPRTLETKPLSPRKISGFCIQDGEFLRLIYETRPQSNDRSRGFGVMLFQFLPSNEDAYGFYASRSAKTGAMVCGKFSLSRPEKFVE